MASTAALDLGYTALEIPHGEDAQWSALLASHPGARSIVPKREELAGWRAHRIGAFSGSALEGGLVVGLRRIPKLPFQLSRITMIMLAEGRETEMLELLLREVERFAARNLALETELQLRIPATEGIHGFGYHRAAHELILDHGYRQLQKVDTTYLVDIDRDDDRILASFQQKTRNKVRKALKDGARVEISDDLSLLRDFYEAHVDMSERKAAPIPPRVLIGEGLLPLLDAKQAVMVVERYGDRIANMVIVDALGIPVYSLGARMKAPVAGDVTGAAQVLHFEIMRMMRARKKKYYDLGGCEGPVPIEGHPNFGVWRFKYNFCGRFVRFLPYYRKTRGVLLRPVMDAVHRLRGDWI
jgi:GNAT acetyltransferase-like protein